MPHNLEAKSAEPSKEEAEDIFKEQAVICSVVDIIHEYFWIDEEFRKQHDGQFAMASYESAKIYPTEEEAHLNKSNDFYKQQIIVRMNDPNFKGCALITDCQVKWFKERRKAFEAINNLPEKRRKKAIEWYFTSSPEIY